MFQSTAFQSFAFQTVGNTVVQPGDSGDEKQTYVPQYQRYANEERQRQKIRRDKTELERLESVLKETERKKELASESKRIAEENNKLQRAIQLEKSEREYLEEINRLIMVKADLIRRIRRDEESLLIIIMARKRRLRFAVQPASRNSLH